MQEWPSDNVEVYARRSAGYAQWIALGAVVAGAVGAIVGARRCSAGHARFVRPQGETGPDAALLTAPHGDKLAVVR